MSTVLPASRRRRAGRLYARDGKKSNPIGHLPAGGVPDPHVLRAGRLSRLPSPPKPNAVTPSGGRRGWRRASPPGAPVSSGPPPGTVAQPPPGEKEPELTGVAARPASPPGRYG